MSVESRTARLTVSEVSRMSKGTLVQMILSDARRRGRVWALGGPQTWSKDELVAYLVRDTELVAHG